MLTEQRIRTILFYLSLLVFLIGLPFILSFALSYKFDPHTFKFTKTGIISIRTQPAGGVIYLGNKVLNEKTPATIYELVPGNYNLKIEMDEYYPWSAEARVDAGKVTRLEQIILFPLRPEIKQLNQEKISAFWIDYKRGVVYYIDEEERAVYKSNLEGEDFEEIASLPESISRIREFRVSPDRKKLLCFNNHRITVIYLGPQNNLSYIAPLFDLEYSNDRITDVFWHSDSYHIILITAKNIEVREVREGSLAVNLVTLNRKNPSVFSDENVDILYFTDDERAPNGQVYTNLYKLDLSKKFSPIKEIVKTKADEQ